MNEIKADVRQFTGMYGWPALLFAVVFLAGTWAYLLPMPDAVNNWAIEGLAMVLAGAAVLGLLYFPGDPLPLRWSVAIVTLLDVGVILDLVQRQSNPGGRFELWANGVGVAVLTLLGARGAFSVAWIGFIVMQLSIAGYCHESGQGLAAAIFIATSCVAPMLMSSYFLRFIRPTVRLVVDLRRQANERAANEGAFLAAQAERDEQLAVLQSLAEPLLARIAANEPVDSAFREECRLLETHLRDRVRARLLVEDDVAAAARDARSRGVHVVLLDDSEESALPITSIRECVVSELSDERATSLTARLLPAGREFVASITMRGPGFVRDVAVDASGKVVVHA